MVENTSYLQSNTDDQTYPCHRVVRSDGRVAEGYAFGERFGQIVRLRAEGVVCLGGTIDLNKYYYSFGE